MTMAAKMILCFGLTFSRDVFPEDISTGMMRKQINNTAGGKQIIVLMIFL
jgi:hypothetical protein